MSARAVMFAFVEFDIPSPNHTSAVSKAPLLKLAWANVAIKVFVLLLIAWLISEPEIVELI